MIFDLENYPKTKLLFDSVFQFQKGLTPYELILMGGAVKGGKSFSSIAIGILLCNTFPNCNGVIVRKTNKVIERNLLPVWNKLDDLCDSNKKLRKIEGDYVKEFNNGSRFVLMAENYQNDKELNALRGLDINFYIMEEANELQEHTFNKLNERNGTNRHSCDIPPIAILTCNPSFGWLKKTIYNKFIDETAPETWLFIPSTAHDNPAIPQSQFDIWRRTLSKYDYWVFIEGNWGVQKKIGSYLKEFDPDKHLTNIELKIDLPIHITFDENVLPYITCSLWQVNIQEKQIIQIGELPLTPPKNTAERAGKEIVKYLKAKGFNEKIFIYGDSTSKKRSTLGKSFFVQIIEQIQGKFYYEKRILNRNESVSLTGVFCNQMLEGSFGWNILINENCGFSISDYVETLEDENGAIKKVRVTDGNTNLSYEKNGHFVDAFRYFLISIFFEMYKAFRKRKF